MKRLLIYILTAAFTLAVCGPATALELRDNQATVSIIKKKDKKKQDEKKKPPQPQKPPKQTPDKTKKYDNFIDRNNNGIDDRKENLKQKPSKKDSTKTKDKKEG